MKYWIIGLVVAVLGLGEYVYVEVAPYPPKMRMNVFVSLPIVKPFSKPILKAYARHEFDRRVKEEPSPWTYQTLHLVSKHRGDEEMVSRALDLLRSDETDTARFVLYQIENGSVHAPIEEWELERAVLLYRMLEERLPSPGVDDDRIRERDEAWDKMILQLYQDADAGDARSQQIVAALEES